ncbi:partial Chemotaxis protein CheY, partial [Anaerolineae bacterium]
ARAVTGEARESALSGKRILIVDDEKTIRETLQDIFTREGFKVETARDGREALDLIEKEKFALVITDLKMPGYGGMDLYGSVLKKHAYLKDKIIILTGDVFSEDVREFLNASGCPYVLKPFEPKKLIEIAVKLLS